MNVDIQRAVKAVSDYMLNGAGEQLDFIPIKAVSINSAAIMNDINLTILWATEESRGLYNTFKREQNLKRLLKDVISAVLYDVVLNDVNELDTIITLFRHYISGYLTKMVRRNKTFRVPKDCFNQGLAAELDDRLIYAYEFFNFAKAKGKEEAISHYNKYRKDVAKASLIRLKNDGLMQGGVLGEDFELNIEKEDISEYQEREIERESVNMYLDEDDKFDRVHDDELSNQQMDNMEIGSKDKDVQSVVTEEQKNFTKRIERQARAMKNRQRMARRTQEEIDNLDDFDDFLV